MGSKEFENALRDRREIEVHVIGRNTGREISLPVWFVQVDRQLNLLPVTGSDSNWYQNLRSTPEVRLTANGAEYRTQAVPVTDTAKVDDVVQRFRDKYGADSISTYYTKRDVAVEVPLG
jgi:hypothetical protein